MNKGIGGHQSTVGRSDERLTPPEIIRALGPFDLDPCAPIIRPWDMAKRHLTIEDNGLAQSWEGNRVWFNPPYNRYTIAEWMKRISDHGNGIALLFARTETEVFQQYAFATASSMFFLKGRLHFYDVYGNRCETKKGEKANGGAPSVLIAYGDQNSQAISDSGLQGAHLPVNVIPVVVVGVSPSWRMVITIAVNRNNGEADCQTIYGLVERIAPDKVQNNFNYKEKIRQQLQYHFTRIAKGRYTNSKLPAKPQVDVSQKIKAA
jgi:hypothetical protein